METSELKQIIREVIKELNYNDYISPETVATKLEVDPETVRRWCRTGELKSSKFGRLFRIRQQDFAKFCKDREL